MAKSLVSLLKNKRILFVEPNEGARLALKERFEKLGATVYVVGQVEKLKSLVEGAVASDQLFDIIVADVELPGTFGFYAIKVMKEALKGRKIPMFVMSAHFSKSALEQLVRWRVLGYIRKPLKLSDLENFILDRYIFFAETVLEYKKHNDQFRIDESELRKKVS